MGLGVTNLLFGLQNSSRSFNLKIKMMVSSSSAMLTTLNSSISQLSANILMKEMTLLLKMNIKLANTACNGLMLRRTIKLQ